MLRLTVAMALTGALFSGQLGLAAPAQVVLVVWDSTQPRGAGAFKGLLELLKQQRAQGHFVGLDVDPSFRIYDLAVPEHARSLKLLGLGRPQQPLLCLTQVNPKGLPNKVLWHCEVSSADQALSALDTRLGIGQSPAVATSPSPTPTPLPAPSQTPVAVVTPNVPVVDTFTTGHSLLPGMALESQNHLFQFVFQRDGNCVVYRLEGDARQPVWSTGTGANANHLELERNGLLQVLKDDRSLWQSRYAGLIGIYRCQMRDDGNLAVERQQGDQWILCWSSKRGVEDSYRVPPGLRLDRRGRP